MLNRFKAKEKKQGRFTWGGLAFPCQQKKKLLSKPLSLQRRFCRFDIYFSRTDTP